MERTSGADGASRSGRHEQRNASYDQLAADFEADLFGDERHWSSAELTRLHRRSL